MNISKHFTKFQLSSFLGLGFGLLLTFIGIFLSPKASPYIQLQCNYSVFKTYSSSSDFYEYYMCAYQQNEQDNVRLFCRPLAQTLEVLPGAFNIASDGIVTPQNPDQLRGAIRLKQFYLTKAKLNQLYLANGSKEPISVQLYPSTILIGRITYKTFKISYDGVNMQAILDPCPPATPPAWDSRAGNNP